MIRYENLTDGLVRAYSTSGLMITRDGINYEEAIDPTDKNRKYEETDIPIINEISESEYAEAGKILLGVEQ